MSEHVSSAEGRYKNVVGMKPYKPFLQTSLNTLFCKGLFREMVPPVGVEPTLLAEPDFESGASTNFTTGA